MTARRAIIIIVITLLSISILMDIFQYDFPSLNNVNDLEIERKWVINPYNIPYDLEGKADKFEITQDYINYSPEIRVREIIYNDQPYYTMTIKRNVENKTMSREELDFNITKQEYKETVASKIGTTIKKTRYQLEFDGDIWAFDIFHGELDGLAYLEIEFDNEYEASLFRAPDWVVKEVTADKRYKNQSLSKLGLPNR